jgi:hypothetical protein
LRDDRHRSGRKTLAQRAKSGDLEVKRQATWGMSVVYPALRNGAYYPWEFQPLQKASERYMRNHMDLNVLEEQKRFPRGE